MRALLSPVVIHSCLGTERLAARHGQRITQMGSQCLERSSRSPLSPGPLLPPRAQHGPSWPTPGEELALKNHEAWADNTEERSASAARGTRG